MLEKSKILNIVYRVFDELNEQRDANSQLSKSTNTPIHSSSGGLYSLGLVNFIVSTEQYIEESFGVTIQLADESFFDANSETLATVDAFVDYTLKLLQNENIS